MHTSKHSIVTDGKVVGSHTKKNNLVSRRTRNKAAKVSRRKNR